jgi:hypothetical protein
MVKAPVDEPVERVVVAKVEVPCTLKSWDTVSPVEEA